MKTDEDNIKPDIRERVCEGGWRVELGRCCLEFSSSDAREMCKILKLIFRDNLWEEFAKKFLFASCGKSETDSCFVYNNYIKDSGLLLTKSSSDSDNCKQCFGFSRPRSSIRRNKECRALQCRRASNCVPARILIPQEREKCGAFE